VNVAPSVRRALAVLGVVVTFVLASLGGLALHLDAPVGRRAVARVLERLLSDTFRGRFEITSLDHLSLGMVTAREVKVRDPRGELVLAVQGLRAHADVLGSVSDVLFGEGKLTIVVHHARAEKARVVLIPDPKSGIPSIAAAFELIPPKNPSPGPARPVRVWLPAIEIGKGEVRGTVAGLPKLDADVFGARGSVLVAPTGVAVDAPHFSAVVRSLLPQELRAVGSFHQRGTTRFWSNLDGFIGELQVDARARLEGSHLEAVVDLPRAEPGTVRALLPDWPLRETAVIHAEASGDLPELAVDARATLAAAELDAQGTLLLGVESRARLDVRGKRLDLRAVLADAPETSIDARAKLAIVARESRSEVELDGASEPTVVAGVPVPAVEFRARYADKKLEGSAKLHEQGMPLAGTFALRPDGSADFAVELPRFRLERAPRLARLGFAGSVALRAKGRIASQRLEASASADFEELRRDFLRLGRGHVEARAKGPLANPRALELDGRVVANDAEFGALHARELEATARGRLDALEVGLSLRDASGVLVDAKTRMSTLGTTRFQNVDIVVARESLRLHATAGRVELTAEGVEVTGLLLEGSGGTLTASGRYRPGLFELDARGERLDLDTIGRVLGVQRGRFGGKLDLSTQFTVARDVRRGTLGVELRDGAFGKFESVDLDVAATLEGENLTGESLARVAGYGSLRSSFELVASGSLFEGRTWREVTGRWDLALERLELSSLLPHLPESLRIVELGGSVIGQATLLRPSPETPPSLSVLAATDKLGFTRAGADGAAPLVVKGVELQFGGSSDGATGVTEVSARLVDAHGLLLTASGRGELALERALTAPGELFRRLRERPVALTLVVDGRPLEELPEFVRPKGWTGVLRAEASLRGTLAAPVLAGKASLAGVVFGDAEIGKPFDVCARAQYDPGESRIGLGAELYVQNPVFGACQGQRVALGNATGSVDFAAFARGERGFSGDAQVALEGLPLERIGAFAQAGMLGLVDGRLAYSGTEEPPQLSGKLTLREGAIRGVPLGGGDFSLRADGRDARVELKLRRGDGSLEGEARAGVDFSRALPRVDGTRPVYLRAAFENLDAGVLGPVLSGTLDDLGGRLDGTVTAALAPRDPARPDAGFDGEVTGKVSMLGGTFQIAGLGMRLTAVKFDAEATRKGARTTIAIRGLSGASRSRYPNVAATADLYLDGLTLEGGRANANLRQVPLLIGGVSQANLSGSASLELRRSGDVMRALVRLPELTAELPPSAGGDVISVDEHPDLAILQPIGEPRVIRSGDTLRWELLFDLGKKVRVVRGDLQIPLVGRALIELGDPVKVSGDLELKAGGRVQLLGKSFVIETGEIHFDTGDPGNPHIRVLASWRAPDQTTVWVEVRGTFREAKLRLESDPVLSEAEIQALLLGGRSQGEDQTASSIGYGTNFVGELLSNTPFRRLELRLGAERTVDDRSASTYTAAVPLSDTLWLEGTYMNVNSSDVGEQDSAVSTTIEWRFRQNWALRTEVGTTGGGLDLLWQYRY
jgi:autotransporter translocation and assembly factor TamB